ncbi:benzoate 1,2-dioxygenase electron transfer component BenC [Gordonia terrae]|uniref:1,6-dihydroxycyclohexa-2,4-diene-1-carboxylate dehydrogenase n=2 Tax=Gordonia terrae TaxID=2055 RepID=A0AAD0NX27_9ACTN|nr:benzoate 1,2-dioxygenase electron transfer component BenC [Gordonia terrae]VTR07906.1 sorbitol-6-phosphate 2-dehydrogenase SrlD [Clostridioides difficile]ANY25058.1 oxidoreductase [Gordonia terrae]AWO85806.1 1,6-dihydroxycyclohexa-2,4-diene-1-carboxylate dehydrogenase [Gordonia terrae]VTS61504.1 Benzoate 1,2-dioxygenase electron transfer component [Gordonia terrae]GAB45377.1 benzoate 1,2-dioxygenase reductase component/2-hydro-1,2-dihydroxybenzoate dehydrogenase [Gordonia terrae NBRC 100016
MTVTTEAGVRSGTGDADTATHQVALSFEDGVTRFITCREDQTVADASYRQRINIPLDCRDGACGTCKSLCESGDYDGGTYIEDALTDDESAQGYALPCCMKPRSDLVLQIPATSDIAKTQAARFTGTVAELDRLSESTFRLGIRIENRGRLAFLPGQYVNIEIPGTDDEQGNPVTRSYSFANGPHEDRLIFLIKLTPGGAMSTYLTQRATRGEPIAFTGPHGSFFLREADRPVLLLAGGTGLAPILSMLRKMHSDNSRRKVHLIYGVSTDTDLVAVDEIDWFVGKLPGFTWEHCVSDPASSAPNKGYVMSLIEPAHLNDGDVAIYLCGPPPMVEAVRQHVAQAGIEPTGFYYEKFALAAHTAPDTEAGSDAGSEINTEVVRDEVSEVAAPEAALSHDADASGFVDTLLLAPDARAIAGQETLPSSDLDAWSGPRPVATEDTRTCIGGQPVWRSGSGATALDSATDWLQATAAQPGGAARSIAGQEMFAATDITQLYESIEATTNPPVSPDNEAPPASTVVGSHGYQIGEEHPGISESDALFEARAALELGALELTFGRLSTQQLVGYRLLADATAPYVDGDRFVDSAEYTETNAAFHDYLFTLTGNDHLLEAYKALGVKGRMSEVLRNATWCHPRCAQDHLDIVTAFESGDHDAARGLIVAHADRSKQTMRRAMSDEIGSPRPRFVTPGRFAGKVVVITGAAQGIGEQTARRISAEGGRVVLADRSDLVDEVARDLADTGSGAVSAVADLETFAGAEAVVRRAVDTFGRVDVLINNVGGAINFKPFTEFTDEQIRAEIDRSLMTTLFTCRAALPSMVRSGRGVIVNVSSAATRGVHRIPYSAAKGAVNALTASLALEYADHGIRVVATAPGGTEAPPRRISRGTPEPRSVTETQWYQAHIDQTLSSSTMHRYGTLDEQAAALCFLASDEASYITGTVLPVAGGDQG